MRSVFARCLILILSLALVGGNAHAALHVEAAHTAPCPEERAHHPGKTEPHQHDTKMVCCCDCLGCTSAAYLAPELSSAPAELATRVHYDADTFLLCGRALRPEPDPPRPATLS
jgi:hypothetical protein